MSEVAYEKLIEDLAQEIGRRTRGAYQPVPVKEYYDFDEVARLLKVHVQRIRDMAHREEDPLPFLRFPGLSRKAIIHREDLKEWLVRNGKPPLVLRSGEKSGE